MSFRILIAALLLAGSVSAPAAAAGIAASATQVHPLLIGSAIPATTLADVGGKSVPLRTALTGKYTLLVFYRGGWCPYCNLELSNLRLIEGDLKKLGVQVVAITPDRPAELRKTLDKNNLSYTLLSDTGAATMQAFGVAFRVDDATAKKYREYGIDLDTASGNNHRALPVPAVFLIDPAGKIRFQYVNPDYQVRVPHTVVLAAAKAARDEDAKRAAAKAKGAK